MSIKTACIMWAVTCILNALPVLVSAIEDWKKLSLFHRVLRLNTPFTFFFLAFFIWMLADRVK